MKATRALAVGLSVSLAAMAVAAEGDVRWMYGKWCSIGTSITWYNDHVNNKFTKGYQTRVCEVLKFQDFQNVGISGAYISKSLGTAVRADYYTIEHGINDWGSAIPVGTIDDYRNNTKNGTFCASYRQMIDEIRGLNPAAKIILCTPRKGYGAGWFPMSSSGRCDGSGNFNASRPEADTGTYLKDYVDAVKAIADEENLPVADFYTTCGEDVDLPSLSQDVAVHPNDTGYQLMADELLKAFAQVAALPKPEGWDDLKWHKVPGGLIENVSTGTPWELKLSDAGAISVVTVGDSSVIDLSESKTGSDVEIKRITALGGASVVEIILPDTVTRVDDAAFAGSPNLKHVRLSVNLTYLGRFSGCSNLETVDNLVPPKVTQITPHLMESYQKVASPVEIGFGTDDEGKPIPVELMADWGNSYSFYCCYKIPSMRIGPGVVTIPKIFFGALLGLGYLELGENVLTNLSGTAGLNNNSLSNIVMKTTATTYLGAPLGGSALREIHWSGGYVAGPGVNPFSWTDRQVRFFVPGDNRQWASLMSNPTQMTPWGALAADVKQSYFTRFGEDAEEPTGLSVKAVGFPETWILSDGAVPEGCVLSLSDLSPAFGSIIVTPAPDEGGLYEKGTVVTFSLTLEDGVVFRGWTGDVAEEDRMKTAIELTMDGNKSLSASVYADFWSWTSGILKDGLNVLTTSGNEGAIKITGGTLGGDGTLDLSKPVNGGVGKIASIDHRAFANRAELVHLKLPDTLQEIGQESFSGCRNLETVEPFLPSKLTALYNQAFKSCEKLVSPLEIGFGTNETTGAAIAITQYPEYGAYYYYFNGCSKVPSMRVGPGFSLIGSMFLEAGMSSVGYLELHQADMRSAMSGFSSLTCIVHKATATVQIKADNAYAGTSLREIIWNGWFEVAAGKRPFSWNDKQVRFVVPGDDVNWAAFMGNESKVMPWNKLGADVQQDYYARYGEDAREPAGLSVGETGFPQTWIVTDGKTLPGSALIVEPIDAAFGTISVTPSPTLPGNLYPDGAEVVVSISLNDGVNFRGWSGVPDEDKMKTSLVLTMDASKSLSASIYADFWSWTSGILKDGLNVLTTSGNEGAIKITGGTLGGDGTLDLSKPVNGGVGKIASIDHRAFANRAELVHLKLPDTLQEIGQESFSGCRNLETVEPFLPSKLTALYNQAFKSCEKLVSPLEIGFGTNETTGAAIAITQYPEFGEYYYCFNGCSKVPSMRVGPGFSLIGSKFLEAGMSSVGYLELHQADMRSAMWGFSSLTCIVHKATATVQIKADNAYTGTSLREIIWNGWFEVADGKRPFSWNDKQVRFVVPKNNAEWRAFAADVANVTPWAQLDAATKTQYRDRFGRTSGKPYGLITSGAYGLPQTWLVIDGLRDGLMLLIK